MAEVFTDALRSIPAWAGETELELADKRMSEVYPRVGGGNSEDWTWHDSKYGLSPRGRGKRRQRQ